MAPKKKTATAIGSLGAELPVPVRASSGPVADRTRAAVHEHQRRPGSQSLASGVVRAPDDRPHVARSKDGAGPPAGGAGPSRIVVVPPPGSAATSKTPTPATTALSSHGVRDDHLLISSNSNAGGAGEGARGAGGRWTGGCSAARGTGSGEVG